MDGLGHKPEEEAKIGRRSQQRIGTAIDDQHQHRANVSSTSHHLKQRHTPPPLVKTRNRARESSNTPMTKTSQSRPNQDALRRARNRHHRRKITDQKISNVRPKIRSEKKTRLTPPHATKSESGLRDHLHNPKSRLFQPRRHHLPRHSSMTKNGSPLQRSRLRESLSHRTISKAEGRTKRRKSKWKTKGRERGASGVGANARRTRVRPPNAGANTQQR
ncbi:hypothetical protein YC2023_122897 [Brassica napus]